MNVEACRENILGFYDILLQKEFDVALSVPETPVFARGDQDALQRVLYNLLSNVFDRLYTMEDSRNGEKKGNGLGLTIAKNLVERRRWKCWIWPGGRQAGKELFFGHETALGDCPSRVVQTGVCDP